MTKCTHLTNWGDGDVSTLTCSIGSSMWRNCHLLVKCVTDYFFVWLLATEVTKCLATHATDKASLQCASVSVSPGYQLD